STSATNILASGTSFTLTDNPFTLGWSTGDVITIGQTRANMTNETEKRTITGIAANVITVDSAFTKFHYSTDTVQVANLSRNVLVRSTGTAVASNTSYIRNLVRNTTSFAMTYGEFAYLGAWVAGNCPGTGTCGIMFDGTNITGSISSSTIHDGV